MNTDRVIELAKGSLEFKKYLNTLPPDELYEIGLDERVDYIFKQIEKEDNKFKRRVLDYIKEEMEDIKT